MAEPALFTASGAERASACPASCALPRAASSSKAARRGLDVHAFIRRVLAGADRSVALTLVEPEHKTMCEGIDFRRMGGDLREVKAEAAWAYDAKARTARFIGLNVERNYGPLDTWEIPGTVDIQGLTYADTPVVCDTKTGKSVGRVATHAQTNWHAMVQAVDTGASEVEGRIYYVRPDGYVRPEGHTFKRFDLDVFADEMEETAVRAQQARADLRAGKHLRVVEGDHCTYCECYSSCPAKVALARSMQGDLKELAVASIAEMAPAEVVDVHVKLASIKELTKRIDYSLNAYVSQQEIDVGDGRTLRMTTRHVDRFQADDALALLREKGATEEEIAKLYLNVEESAGRRIVGSKAKGRAA